MNTDTIESLRARVRVLEEALQSACRMLYALGCPAEADHGRAALRAESEASHG